MAENKKSVLLYCDIIHTVKELSDEEAGKLFKHYLEYINDLNPNAPDKLTQIVFEPIKQNLKRDLKKWEATSERNAAIAREAWEKRKNANACERMQEHTKNTDKDKGTDTVIVKDKGIVKVKEKKEIKENVYLSDNEVLKLKEFFLNKYEDAISILSNYKSSSGKKYKSDYHALVGWVAEKIKKEISNGNGQKISKGQQTVNGIRGLVDKLRSVQENEPE